MRIEQITFTRFIAALSIVIFHFARQSFLFNNDYVSFIFRQADVGVSYFFILSGFVMIVAYNGKGTIGFLEYIRKRLARIFPAYLLGILLIVGIQFSNGINCTDLFLNVFMLQAWVPGKALTLNYPGWSLSVELFFYISFPLLMNHCYRKWSFKKYAVGIIFIWLLSQMLFHCIAQTGTLTIPFYSVKDLYYLPLLHLNEFLIGNLAGLFFMAHLKDRNKNYLVPILLLFVVLLLALKFPLGLNFHNGLLALLFIPMIFLISLSTDAVTRTFNRPFLVFLGEISYGIYILQAPVWIIFSDSRMLKYFKLDKETDLTLSFFIRLLILIVFASLSYLYFEKPLRNTINQWNKKKIVAS